MQQIISRVLVFGRNPHQRARAMVAMSRCAIEPVEAADLAEAVGILTADPSKIPGLAIMHPDYESECGPLALYSEIRTRRASWNIPLLILVETQLERATVQTMNLQQCACCLVPLSHAALVFALPSLGLCIRDSVVFQQNAMPARTQVFQPDRETHSSTRSVRDGSKILRQTPQTVAGHF